MSVSPCIILTDAYPASSDNPDGLLITDVTPTDDGTVAKISAKDLGGRHGRATSSQITGAHTFQSGAGGGASDVGSIVESMSDTPVTWTIPADLPEGAVIEVFQYGAGQVTIASDGPTLLSDGGKIMTAGQYATIGIRIRAGAAEAVLSGDLA